MRLRSYRWIGTVPVAVMLIALPGSSAFGAIPTATESAQLVPWDVPSAAGFGYGTDVSGDVAAVCAGYTGAGSVYVFRRINGAWTPWSKLVPSGFSTVSAFGSSISISSSGNLIVVGATGDKAKGIMAGSAFVFENVGGTWTQVTRLLASDGVTQDHLGFSVGCSDNVVLVGTIRDSDFASHSGSVYVYEKVGGVWTQVAKLHASDPSNDGSFGYSIDVSGTEALIGARFGKSAGGVLYHGSAYVFERLAGVWTQTAKLNSLDGVPQDQFGVSASLEGNVAVIGAQGDDDNGSGSGSAYVFEKIAGVWTQYAKLLPADGAAGGSFGCALAMADGDVVIGAYAQDNNVGAAYNFRKTSGSWTQVSKLVPSNGVKLLRFGMTLGVSNHVAVIGDFGNSDVAYSYDLRFLPYGNGCAGTGGVVPYLRGRGDAVPGGTVTIDVENGQPSASGLLFLGVQQVQLPVGYGCDLLVGPVPPVALPLLLDGAGEASIAGPIPVGTSGLVTTAQAFLSDGGVSAGFSTTNGLSIEIE